jgi:DNA replicative helicase MCM subunit Mcm2 (Cdc46/Mcm family)
MIMTTNNTNSNDSHTNPSTKKIFSVLEAKQVNSGKITVCGMIISRSMTFKTIAKSEWECQNISCATHGCVKFNPPRVLPPEKFDNTNAYRLKCTHCGSDAFDVEHECHDTVSIQIVDNDKADNYNSLDVMLYDDATRNIVAGEVVTITGEFYTATPYFTRTGKTQSSQS